MTRALIVLSILALSVSVASAQPANPVCDPKESFRKCLDELLDGADQELLTKQAQLTQDLRVQERDVPEKVEEKASPSTSPGAQGAVIDFLPALVGSLGLQGLSNTDGNLNFDKVFELGKGWRLDLGTTAFTNAEVFEPLKTKLSEAEHDDLAGELDEAIGDFDKTDFRGLLTWHWGIGRHRFGRDPVQYQAHVERWFEDAVTRVEETPIFRWRGRADTRVFIDRFPGFLTERIDSLKDEDQTPLTATEIATIEASLVEVAKETKEMVRSIDEALSLDTIDELIANQPQFIVRGGYSERRDFTGPSERSGGVDLEIGLSGNLNDFFSWAKDHPSQCPEGTDPAAPYSLACLQAYLGQNAGLLGMSQEKAAAKLGHRLAIAYSYIDTDPFSFTDDDNDFSFALDGAEKHSGSLTWGFYFSQFQLPNLLPGGSASQPTGTARFDLESKYDDVTGDPMLQSRWTATATLSQKMSDNTVLSISAVWAEKPEYRGEVDEEVSANFGFKWQRDRPKE